MSLIHRKIEQLKLGTKAGLDNMSHSTGVGKFILVSAFLASAGCALLGGGDDDPATKAKDFTFKEPGGAFRKLVGSTADHAWQSSKTGNTLAVNTTCQKYSNVSLADLTKNILAGIENLKVEDSTTSQFDGREAQHTHASGATDGVPIRIDLLTYKKNNCAYDITLIGLKKGFDEDHELFEEFLRGFHAP